MDHTIKLKSARKAYTRDQDKIYPPQETVRRFRERLKRIDLDILEGTERIDKGRLDIPVFFSRCGQDAQSVIGTKKQMGKGGTPAQAEASAVMELAERFSFFSFSKNSENFISDTYQNVAGQAISFNAIAKSVHDTSEDLEISRKIFADLPLQWTWGYNLTRKEEVLIPFDWFFTINEFNGPSAGNCTEEAVNQGICEVVERHVSSLISRDRLQVPLIRPESATDPLVLEMLNKYASAGIKVFLSDFTLDMGIPTVGVLAYDPTTFPTSSEIVWTAGTTSSPQKALSRALTETAQLAGDFNTQSNYVASGLPKLKDLAETTFITHVENRVDLADLPDISNNDMKIEIENSLTALKKNDFEVLLINTTHPLLEIPAYYTIIPGAHFRERATGTSVGMFAAKLITEKNTPWEAHARLLEIDALLPNKYYIQFYLGLSLLSLKENEAALFHLKQALNLNPPIQEMASVYSYMGVAYKEMGAYEKAIQVLKEGETYDQERTDIYNLMGFCFFKLKKHEQAIENFAKVLELNPGSAIDYANIGSNYREMGEKDKAIAFYEIALSIDPDIEFARESIHKLKNIAS